MLYKKIFLSIFFVLFCKGMELEKISIETAPIAHLITVKYDEIANILARLPEEFNSSLKDLFIKHYTVLKPTATILEGHSGEIVTAAFGPNHVLTGSTDKTSRLWNIRKLPITEQIFKGHTGEVCTVAFTFDGCATGSFDTIRLWNIRTPLLRLRFGSGIRNSCGQ